MKNKTRVSLKYKLFLICLAALLILPFRSMPARADDKRLQTCYVN